MRHPEHDGENPDGAPGSGGKPALGPYLRQTLAASTVLWLFLPAERALAECVSTDPGTVTCTGTDQDGLQVVPPPPPGPDLLLTVEPGAMVNGPMTIDALSSLTFHNHGQINGNITVTNNGDFSFDQNGTFGGTTLSVSGSGGNDLLVRSGRSINTTILSGARNRVDNFGVLNNAVTLTATESNTVVNRTGAAINQLTLAGTSNTVDNDGLFNQGLSFANGHAASGLDNVVHNRANGVINGISSTGGSHDEIDNSGVINGPVNLGAGNDNFVNRAQTNGSVDLGPGNDLFAMVGGTMCCTVNLGDGNDLAFIFGGTISSDVQAGAGNDFLAWQGGRIVSGVRMGEGDDNTLLSGLDATQLAPGLTVDGGTGTDRLIWNNSRNGATGLDVAQLTYWESVEINARSELTFKNYSSLTLGDPGTGTGTLSVDSSSTVFAGGGTHAVRPWNPGALANVANAGTIDLTNGPAAATDRFVIYGNYVGRNGHLNLQTVLGADDSPSDQLVIQRASAATDVPLASGLTTLNVTNLNGAGAMTTGNGIRVVDAIGALTTAEAFVLGERLAAGVYEYALFRGGVAPDEANDNDWFLRSSVPDPTQPPTTLPAPVPPLPPVPPATLPAPVPPIAPAPPEPAPAPPSPPSTLPAPLPPPPEVEPPPAPEPPPPEPPPIDPPPPVPEPPEPPPPGEPEPPEPPPPGEPEPPEPPPPGEPEPPEPPPGEPEPPEPPPPGEPEPPEPPPPGEPEPPEPPPPGEPEPPEPPPPGEPEPPEPPPPGEPEPPEPPPPGEPEPPDPPPPGGIPPGGAPPGEIPLIRPEIPGHVLGPVVAQQMGLAAVGTFHERRGDQSLLHQPTGGAWTRVLGDRYDQRWSSSVPGTGHDLGPRLRSHLFGIQAGADVYARDEGDGRQDRVGAFYAYTETRGTVYGNTLAVRDNRSGDLDLKGDSAGLYWTHVAPSRWYVDAVAMYTRFKGEATSSMGVRTETRGHATAASVETGVPFPLNARWTLEPQGQLIWQHIDFRDGRDPYASIEHRHFDTVTGRLGVRLEHDALVRGQPWQSFVGADVWHTFSKTSETTFDRTRIGTALGGTALELRGGVTMNWTPDIAGYVAVGYTTDLDGERQHGFNGTIGIRARW